MRTFNERLQLLRKERELSQQKVADAIGVSQRAISQLETQSGRVPSAENLRALALFFEVDPEWLLTGKGVRNPVASLSPEETELLMLFRSLSLSGKSYIVGRTQDVYRDEFGRTPPKPKSAKPADGDPDPKRFN